VSAGYAVFSENAYLGRCGVTLGLGSGPLTIEMSVQIPDDASPPWFMHSLFSYETYSVSGWDLLLFNTAGKLELIQNGFTATHGYQDPPPFDLSDPPPFDLSDGAWYHLAVTREVVADVCTYSFYKNGIMVGSPTSDPAYPTCPTIPDGGCVVLGQEQNKDTECGGFKSVYDLVGNMTEVRVWKTARSPEQILANMELRITDKEKDLVAAWPLDCRHYYDDIMGNADLSGCVPATSWTAEVAHYSLPEFDGEGCPSPECTNECYNGTHNCHAHATCDNTENSFECTCDAPHWEGDGVSCVPTKPFKEHGCPTGRALPRTPDPDPGCVDPRPWLPNVRCEDGASTSLSLPSVSPEVRRECRPRYLLRQHIPRALRRQPRPGGWPLHHRDVGAAARRCRLPASVFSAIVLLLRDRIN